MSHKLVKRHCSCRPSSCNCSPIIVTLQISCSCPQICTCPSTVSPTYPPVTYTMPVTTMPPPVTYTLPPPITYTVPPPVTYTLPPPVTYTLPPVTQAPIAPTQSPYCCILFICSMCNFGSGRELSPYRPSPASSQYQSVPDYQHPSQLSTYHYPTSNYIHPDSDGYKSSFPSQYPLLPSPSSTSLSALSSAPQQTPYAYPASGSKCSIGFAICFGGSFCCRE
uniref:Uncharacterized protein n=1 Tax=Setaria digitata TaxID=48799 RepID=A0A915Q7S3_9BILA